METSGLTADIPVLAGQSSIDELLGSTGMSSGPGPQEAWAEQAGIGLPACQPALF